MLGGGGQVTKLDNFQFWFGLLSLSFEIEINQMLKPRVAVPRPAKEVRGRGNLGSARGRSTAFNPMFLMPPCSTAQGCGAGAATTENFVIAQDTLSSKMIEWADNDQLKEWFLLILLYSACHQSFQTKDQVQLSEIRYQFIL